MRTRKAILWFLIVIACATMIVPGISLLIWIMAWSQQSTTKEDYLRACESAATRMPIAVEFEKLFPGKTDHFITHFGINRHAGDKTNTWNSEAYFYGRYSLTMQIEVAVDYVNNTIAPAGPPSFYLVEHYRIDSESLSSDVREIARFGEAEWRRLYDNKGDFSKIGVNIRQDAPVPHFDEMALAWRSPRIPITLLPDPPKSQ